MAPARGSRCADLVPERNLQIPHLLPRSEDPITLLIGIMKSTRRV